MSDFAEEVDSAIVKAQSKKSHQLFNRTPQHASLLVAGLLRSAKNSLYILTGCLDPKIFDSAEVLSALETIGTKTELQISVIVDGRDFNTGTTAPPNLSDSLFAKRLLNLLPNAAFYKMPASMLVAYKCHFIVGDETSFRFERDWTATEAEADFYSPEFALRLSSFFEKLVQVAEKI